jgi:hypothetical protein
MQATAYVVGSLDGPGVALMDLARRLHFAAVLPYGGLAEAEHRSASTPICFFLFAGVADVAALRGVAEAVRFSSSRHIRFSPLIYFCESPSVETITACINMGFDDIIATPFTLERVLPRVERQVGHSLIYYETPGYFGPDRRDRVTAPERAAETRLGGQFRRLEIIRHMLAGVQVLRDDSYTQLDS